MCALPFQCTMNSLPRVADLGDALQSREEGRRTSSHCLGLAPDGGIQPAPLRKLW